MGAGFSRINSLTIIQTSQGLAEYLLFQDEKARDAGIVVGYDGRYRSRHFAELVAAVFVFKGFKIWWFEDVVHTPLVSFSVKHLNAAAGVMITASHNPAQDNGLKVYAATGCQINAPEDEKIAACIRRNLEPLTWDIASVASSSLVKRVRDPMSTLYIGYLWNYIKHDMPPTFPAFVYTPLHGVGLPFMKEAVQALRCLVQGAEDQSLRMSIVEEQSSPDPTFPTVKYPNPEESSALDAAKLTADRNAFTLIIANDPDADRLAVAEKVGGDWIQFTGDQIGVLLAYYIVTQKRDPRPSGSQNFPPKKQYLLASTVSSQMLSCIAADCGLYYEETLTGFKWLGTRALEIEKEGNECIFAYEEALGYMIPSVVQDKDGILAASVFLSACALWGSPSAKIQELYHKYGCFVTLNTYFRAEDPRKSLEFFKTIRASGDPYPTELAGRTVIRWRDLTAGYDTGTEDKKPLLPCSTSTQMITCWLAGYEDDGVRLTIRGSGTEPKIKGSINHSVIDIS